MQADQGEHDCGNNEDVDGKKAAQGGAADRVASQNKARQRIADQRNAAGLFGRYHYRPRHRALKVRGVRPHSAI